MIVGEQVVIAVVTGVCGLFFTSHEFEFTTPAGCEGLQIMFDSIPSRYYLRNCSLTKD